MTDPIADMLTRIKNGYLSRGKTVSLPYSRFKEELGKLLVKKGYLGEIKVESEKKKTKKTIVLGLKYQGKEPALENVKRISKPSLRTYANFKKLGKIRGLGIFVISTPKGLLTLEEAMKIRLGGEVICQVW
jgi:small subunit ribosomal protein S8